MQGRGSEVDGAALGHGDNTSCHDNLTEVSERSDESTHIPMWVSVCLCALLDTDRHIYLHTQLISDRASQVVLVVKNLPVNAGDVKRQV